MLKNIAIKISQETGRSIFDLLNWYIFKLIERNYIHVNFNIKTEESNSNQFTNFHQQPIKILNNLPKTSGIANMIIYGVEGTLTLHLFTNRPDIISINNDVRYEDIPPFRHMWYLTNIIIEKCMVSFSEEINDHPFDEQKYGQLIYDFMIINHQPDFLMDLEMIQLVNL